ncbi:iron chelate uptake ABC transporter family permease subunit [Tessaracoccus palaemonis]|uniref:Iron chelate uptake ABC transporter family permease subunit n=1 Tax=Tessaracoccus palaemonis TaxID=2829499 RepID=A0ABX8SN09_9ACTN|nr:iron chelate uptake ABC transporter family permease subunit [Tessaracoccus palaemonis]
MLAAAGALVLAVLLSLSVGSNPVPVGQAWSLLLHPDGTQAAVVLRELRLPRTVVGLVVGAALGLGGALMQSLTRNPLADPGILGVNAGAGLAVVLAVAVFGALGVGSYVWFAFVGAAAAAVGVYALGGTGRQAATPVRLALAGVALSAALGGLTQTVILADQQAFNEFRFWVGGSLEGRGWAVLAATGPFIALGAIVALALAPALNALALGEETGRALGVRVTRTRTLAMVAVTLLCGAATAAVGPISFVGLAVPFLARALVGSDQRWVFAVCLLLGPTWLLLADVVARVVVAPHEVQCGIVAALAGAPFFVALVRRRKVAAL